MNFVNVYDDAIPDPESLRSKALAAKFETVTIPGDATYTGVCLVEVHELMGAVRRVRPDLQCLCTAFRINHSGELPNCAVHSDIGYGDMAAVVYLSKPKDCFGGTAFWRHRETSCDLLPDEGSELRGPVIRDFAVEGGWEKIGMIDMRFGRMIMYPTRALHSRDPRPAFGSGLEDGRLIAVGFFR